MQHKSGYQQAMQYQRNLDVKSSKPLPTAEKFLQLCESEYIQQTGENPPELYTKLLGMVTEHLYLESHRPAMTKLLNQTKLLLESKTQ